MEDVSQRMAEFLNSKLYGECDEMVVTTTTKDDLTITVLGCKYEYLDLFDECEIVEYYGDELLSEYEVKQLMTWIDLEDIRNKYGLADYIEYYVKNWHKNDMYTFIGDMYKKLEK